MSGPHLLRALGCALVVLACTATPAVARGGCGTNLTNGLINETQDVILSPSTVEGGSSVRATVTVNGPVTRDLFVYVQANDFAVTGVPACVLLRAPATSASFTFSTNTSRPLPRSVTVFTTLIPGFLQYQARSELTIVPPTGAPQPPPPPQQPPPPPPPSTDSVRISRAEWVSSSRQLRVEATSSNSSARLTAYAYDGFVETLLGTLSGGRGQFTTGNPNVVIVRSSAGGSDQIGATVK